MELLFWGRNMVGGVKWANLEVGTGVVLPALHQVELNRDKIQGENQIKVKRMQVYLRNRC